MDGLISEWIGAVLQLLFAFILAGMFYGGHRIIAAARKRPAVGFLAWVGLTRPVASVASRVWLVLGLLGFSLAMLGVEHLLGLHGELGEMMRDVPVAGLARLEPAGAALAAGVAYAFLRTAGSEELLVRGVLYRRLVDWIGFRPANGVQATLFALLHNGIVTLAVPAPSLLLQTDIFLRIWIPSLVVGWYMERVDGGSLLMPWVCHGIANLVTFLVFFSGRL